jgi:hypothetical protein
MSFEIFHDSAGHWCARRCDGLVCGTFRERRDAERFARRECLRTSGGRPDGGYGTIRR